MDDKEKGVPRGVTEKKGEVLADVCLGVGAGGRAADADKRVCSGNVVVELREAGKRGGVVLVDSDGVVDVEEEIQQRNGAQERPAIENGAEEEVEGDQDVCKG